MYLVKIYDTNDSCVYEEEVTAKYADYLMDIVDSSLSLVDEFEEEEEP